MATYTTDKIEFGGNVYKLQDSDALPLAGGNVTGPVNFGDSVTMEEASVGDIVITGNASATNNLQVNTINGEEVGSTPKFTDTVTTVSTTGSGNAVTAISASNGAITATKGTTFLTSHQTIKQDGITGATVNRYGTCSTAAATAAKTVSITTGTFTLETGAKITVKFTNKNTANSPTLNVNSTGAKNIFHNGTQITYNTNKGLLSGTVEFVYDGTQWQLIGNYVNTTYQLQVNPYEHTISIDNNSSWQQIDTDSFGTSTHIVTINSTSNTFTYTDEYCPNYASKGVVQSFVGISLDNVATNGIGCFVYDKGAWAGFGEWFFTESIYVNNAGVNFSPYNDSAYIGQNDGDGITYQHDSGTGANFIANQNFLLTMITGDALYSGTGASSGYGSGNSITFSSITEKPNLFLCMAYSQNSIAMSSNKTAIVIFYDGHDLYGLEMDTTLKAVKNQWSWSYNPQTFELTITALNSTLTNMFSQDFDGYGGYDLRYWTYPKKLGDNQIYGVVKLTDSIQSVPNADVNSGIAVTPKAINTICTPTASDITVHKPLIVEGWTQLEKQLYLRNDSADGGGIVRFIPQNDDGSNTMYIDTYQQNLRIGSTSLGGYVAQAKPNGYFNVRNGYQIGSTQVYPPKITKGTNISTWESQSITTNYVIKEYSSEYKEIYAAAIFKLPLSSTYGSLYYNDPNLNIPTSFFSGGTGDFYFMSSARSSQGIYSTNVHTWSTSTGNVAVFVGSPVKPSSGTWNVEVYIYGAKF